MADNVRLIDAEIKATQRLEELQKQLNTATGAQADAIQKNIDKIELFIKKASKIKDNVDDFSDLASQISLSSRASDGLTSSLNLAGKQLKSLAKVQVSMVEGSAEAKFVENITDASREILRAQQNVFASADGTAEEQKAATEELQAYQSIFKSYVEESQELLKTNSQLNHLTQGIAGNFAKMAKEMQVTAGLTEDELEAFKTLTQEATNMNGRVKGLYNQFMTLLKKPIVGIGLGVIAVGEGLSKWGQAVRSFGGYADSAQLSTFALGAVFPKAEEAAKGLAQEMGGLRDITFDTQLNTNLIATNMGVSGEEAASLVGNFARLNGNSTSVAADMAESTKELAKQNGLVPSQVMGDVARSSKAFAEYGKQGGKNIGEAAVAAGKLGVNMQALTNVTDHLLDFESSINDELELGAMLGKNINLNNARSLAYNGQIGDAVKDTLNQLGGIEGFNKMDIFQKRKAAQLLGLSVEEFQKMAQNSDKLNSDGTMQLTTFEKWKESLTAFGTGALGSVVKMFGTGLIAIGQMGTGLSALGINMGNMVKSSAQFVANLVKAGASKLFGAGGDKSQFAGGSFSKGKEMLKSKLGSKDEAGPDLGKKGGLLDGMKNIDMNSVLKGAAALVIVAAAVFVFGKAVQEFMKVSWEAVGMAVVSMLALVGAVALLGLIMSSGVGAIAILAGAAAMLIIAAAVLVLGIALQAIGKGFEMLSNGLTTLTPSITAIGGILIELVETIPAIVLLSGALFGLAAALAAVGIAGIVAAPGLMALSTVNAIAGGISSVLGIGGGGNKNDHMDELIAEVKGLRDDLNAGKVAVYLDGVKVTAGVARTVDKQGTNHYAHK